MQGPRSKQEFLDESIQSMTVVSKTLKNKSEPWPLEMILS